MKQHKRLLLIVVAAVVALAGAGVAAAQEGPAVDWWVIAGGGAPSSGTGVTLNDTIGQPVIDLSSGAGVSLAAGYWVGCTAAAAVMPVLTVTVDGADVVLMWDADPNSVQYQVFISTDPYFDPSAVTPVVTTNVTYIDTGAAGSLENHFYVVRGLNVCGAASADSARKGEFTFGLTPGS